MNKQKQPEWRLAAFVSGVSAAVVVACVCAACAQQQSPRAEAIGPNIETSEQPAAEPPPERIPAPAIPEAIMRAPASAVPVEPLPTGALRTGGAAPPPAGPGAAAPVAGAPAAPGEVEAGPPRPVVRDELTEIATAIRQEQALDKLAGYAPRLADLLADSQQTAHNAGAISTGQLLSGLSVAMNHRAAAARLQGDRAGQLAALEGLHSQLSRVREEVKRRVDVGLAPAVDLHAVGFHVERVAAALAREQGDRAARVAAVTRAVAEADAWCEALRLSGEQGILPLDALMEAELCRFAAATALANLSGADPARATRARIAAAEKCQEALQSCHDAAKAQFDRGAADARAVALAAARLAQLSAVLARGRGDRQGEVAALEQAAAEAKTYQQITYRALEAGMGDLPAVLEASRLLGGATCRLALATLSDPVQVRAARREAFEGHRDVVLAVLRAALAKRERAAGSGTDLAYAAARALWIRLQIAELPP